MPDYLNYIDGEWVEAQSCRSYANINPASGEALHTLHDSGAANIAATV